MSRQLATVIEQIIPRYSGALPHELIELAGSLLAQSRSKCSNLKPEEEVNRSYISCHLACERLKGKLNLPQIEVRPYIPRKAYDKLYNYFDRELATSRPTKHARRSDVAAPERPLPQRHTPTKEKSFQSFKASRTPKKGLKYGSSKDQKLPRWVGPAVRYLHADSMQGYENAVPHVFAGVETILFQPCPEVEGWDSQDTMKGKLPALIGAVLLYVMAGMSHEPLHQFGFIQARDFLVRKLEVLRDTPEVVNKVGNDEAGWEGWEEVSVDDIQKWADEIAERGWRDMEWFKNVLNDTGARLKEAESHDEPEEDVLEDRNDAEILEERKMWMAKDPALGRMVQEKYNFLHEDKVTEYEKWKKQMLIKIEGLIDPMEIDI